MKLRILLLEDDFLQRDSIRKALEQNFEGAVVDTEASESEFHRNFEAIASNPPDIAVLDVMLRWANPSPDAPSPPTEAWEPQQAGLRCARLLKQDLRTSRVSVILYTAFNPLNFCDLELPTGAIWLTKELSLDQLIECVRSIRTSDPEVTIQ